MNKEGRKLCGFLKEQDWSMLNGNCKRHEEGELTYVRERGNTVIDYVIGNDRTRERIREFRVKDKIDSDHKSITVWIERERERNNFEECRKGRRRKGGDWSKEGRGVFKEKFRGLAGNGEGERIEEEWEMLKERRRKAIEKVKRKKEKGMRSGMRSIGR